MGQRETVEVVDDLTGCIIDDFVTVSWSIEGDHLEFDTTPESAAAFIELLETYRAASRRVPGAQRSGTTSEVVSLASAHDSRAVRNWARSRGYELGSRGRVPAAIVDEYRRAHHGNHRSGRNRVR